MNKQKYLAELAGLLSFLNEEDRRTVIHYYSVRFEKAGESGEAALILELGPPMRLAIALNRGGIESILDAEEQDEAADTQEPEEEKEPEIVGEPISEETQPETEGTVESTGSLVEPEVLPVAEAEAEVLPVAEAQAEAEEPQDETAPEKTETEEDADAVELVQKTIAEIIDETEEKPAEERLPDVDTAELIREVMREDVTDTAVIHNEAFPELSVVTGKAPRTPETEKEKPKISVLGAMLYVVLLIIPGVPLLALSVLLVPALLVPLGAAAVIGLNGIGAGIATLIYLPDAMFVFGAALVVIGLGLLYLVFVFWLIYLIFRAWRLGIPALYCRLVRREGTK